MNFPQSCRFLEAGPGRGVALCCPLPAAEHRGASRRWGLAAVGPRQRAAQGPLRPETVAGNNPFLLHVALHVLQGVKAKVSFPQVLLNHGWDNRQARGIHINVRMLYGTFIIIYIFYLYYLYLSLIIVLFCTCTTRCNKSNAYSGSNSGSRRTPSSPTGAPERI